MGVSRPATPGRGRAASVPTDPVGAPGHHQRVPSVDVVTDGLGDPVRCTPAWWAPAGVPPGAGGHGALEPSPLADAAARALDHAQEATGAAVRHLLAAQAVEWSGPAAAAFRHTLAEVTGRVRSADAGLGDAGWAVARHAHAVRVSGATVLSGTPVAAGWSAEP